MTDPFTDEQRARLKAAQDLAATMPIRLADAVNAVNKVCENHMEPRSADDLVAAARYLRTAAPERASIRARIATTAQIWRALR